MEKYRIERDSMGEMKVPAERYWGAQTQRSFENFPIGWEKMPAAIIRAFALLKKAAAQANRELKPEKMTEEKCAAICAACDEILKGKLPDEFPLAVWQTGSGCISARRWQSLPAYAIRRCSSSEAASRKPDRSF